MSAKDGTARHALERVQQDLSAVRGTNRTAAETEHANHLIDQRNLSRPVSPQGVLGRDSVRVLLEALLDGSAHEHKGDEQEVVSYACCCAPS